jgi:hypothetical protein
MAEESFSAETVAAPQELSKETPQRSSQAAAGKSVPSPKPQRISRCVARVTRRLCWSGSAVSPAPAYVPATTKAATQRHLSAATAGCSSSPSQSRRHTDRLGRRHREWDLARQRQQQPSLPHSLDLCPRLRRWFTRRAPHLYDTLVSLSERLRGIEERADRRAGGKAEACWHA